MILSLVSNDREKEEKTLATKDYCTKKTPKLKVFYRNETNFIENRNISTTDLVYYILRK